MAEIKISDLTPKGANLIATDLLVISEDIGGGLYETKSITGDEVLNAVAKTAVAVRNQTGETIYKGTIVYISGTSGGKALISKAKADAEITSSKTLGVVTADIANNANGNVLTNGLLTLLDTRTTATHPFTADTLVIGDDLYLSPTNAGYVTNVKPIAPNNLVNIGKVLETSGTTGQILYAIVNGYELGELHDVDTTGAVSGNVLALNGGIWKPSNVTNEFKWTFDLMAVLTYDVYAPYAMKITSVTNVFNAPTTTILDDGAAYTLGATIAMGSLIKVTVSTASVISLNVTKL